MDNRLPPLPGSDINSLTRSRTARDFWGENEINRFEEPEFKKCDHKFKYTSDGVECIQCHFGMLGTLEIRNSKLFYRGKPIYE